MKFCSSLILALLIEATASVKALGIALQPGDVILIHLNCYLCEVIARDGGEGYSHSGIVLSSEFEGNVEPLVGQSISKTEAIPLSEFLQQAKKGTAAVVYRPKEFLYADQDWKKKLGLRLYQNFFGSFLGTAFDQEFLWDNVDIRGRELMYCSEMITKLINTVLSLPLQPEPMHFSERYFEFWNKYFKGNIPEGKLGTSPGSFVRSKLFEIVAKKEIQ